MTSGMYDQVPAEQPWANRWSTISALHPDLMLIRHIREMRSSSKSVRRPGHRRQVSDRGCPLGTGLSVRCGASGTAGEEERAHQAGRSLWSAIVKAMPSERNDDSD